MSNITVSVPDELKQEMESFRIINWSEVARESFVKKIQQLKILESFTKESELTQADALRLGRQVNEALAKRYKGA
jgi:hypothetical protein